VIRIVDTLKEQAGKLTAEERAEYDAMAQGILDQEDRVAIVAYLLKAHFQEEAARGILDDGVASADDAETGAPPQQGSGGRPERGRHGGRGGREGGRGRGEGGRGDRGRGHGGRREPAPNQEQGGTQAAAQPGSEAAPAAGSSPAAAGTSDEARRRRRRRRGRRGRGGSGSDGQSGGSQGGGDRGGPPIRGLGDHYT
jgi:hypothetical protein